MGELVVVVSEIALPQIAVRGGQRRAAGEGEFIDEAPLEGAVEAFAAAAGLRGVADDMFGPQPGQRAVDLREPPATGGAAGGRVCTAQCARSVYSAIGRP